MGKKERGHGVSPAMAEAALILVGWDVRQGNGDHFVATKNGKSSISIRNTGPITDDTVLKVRHAVASSLGVRRGGKQEFTHLRMQRRVEIAQRLHKIGFSLTFTKQAAGLAPFYSYGMSIPDLVRKTATDAARAFMESYESGVRAKPERRARPPMPPPPALMPEPAPKPKMPIDIDPAVASLLELMGALEQKVDGLTTTINYKSLVSRYQERESLTKRRLGLVVVKLQQVSESLNELVGILGGPII